MNTPTHEEILVINGWSIDLKLMRLFSKDEEIYPEPRLVKLLYILVLKKNQITTRDDLLQSVWDDVVVSEDSLTKAIHDLRKFLDSKFAGKYKIITVRRVGYKLIDTSSKVSRKSKLGKVIMKVALILLGVATLFILLVRALSYSQ